MTRKEWEEVEKLFFAALDVDAGQRGAFLQEACGENVDLRREVESLLLHETVATGFLESPAVELAAQMVAEDYQLPGEARSIGPYELLSFLGAGGMGEVHLARDPRLGRKVALKLLSTELLRGEDSVLRFEREARSVSALNHPNILTIYEIGKSEGVHYLATEYIEGQTLRQHMNSGTMEIGQILEIVIQAAHALAAAHDAGIIHRDIKPENIMIRQDGLVKVLDFGLAKLMETSVHNEKTAEHDLKTETGVVMGTTRYMSPEQARGMQADGRTDLFSLGVVLYEMAASRPPFSGRTNADIIASLLAGEPPPISSFVPDVPPELESIVKKALRKDPEERYQTPKELVYDLKHLQRLLTGEDRKKTDSEKTTSPALAKEQVREKKKQARKTSNSVAILPLVNDIADPNTKYLGDGITEGIINIISQLPKLRVKAWSTVSRYRNEQYDPQEAGRQLGVRTVLTGKILQVGKRLIIKMELVAVRDGAHLWGDQYSMEPEEVFAVEEKIAREISTRLLTKLTGAEKQQLKSRYTDHVEAYHAYLRGRYYWNKRTDEDIRKAIDHFKQAIDIDPVFAPAYSGLADCYLISGAFGIATLSPDEAFPKAKEASIKALEIDETLAEPHASLGSSLSYYDWDWDASEKQFRRSLELNPSYAIAHHWYGMLCLVSMGRLEEGLAEVRLAQQLDPLSLAIGTDVGLLLYLARRYDDCLLECRKMLEMDQNFYYAHWKIGLAYEQKGMYQEAILAFRKAIALSGRSALPTALLGHTYAVSGDRSAALQVLAELQETRKTRYVSPYKISVIYAALGENDEAFGWMERALEMRDGWLTWLRYDPVVEPLRSDPRFQSLFRSVYSPDRAAVISDRHIRRDPITSIVILPLRNSEREPELEYLCDGITEQIMNNLSQLPGVRVVARGTAWRYKDKDVHPREVGSDLGVQAVLMGRLRQSGDTLGIAVELTEVSTDSQIWGEQYNRKRSDIFEIQREIASEIAGKLRWKLNPSEELQLARKPTESIEAYHCYLKGRYFWSKRTTESLLKGAEYFRQAIDSDPAYAVAYAGLSDSYTLLVIREALTPEEGYAKAKAAARNALAIDDNLAEAHASLAHAMLHNWEWSDAEKEFQQAIELNPAYASAHHWYSEYLQAMGRLEESSVQVLRAKELDPLSLIINAHLGCDLYFARNHDEAIVQCLKTLEMDPKFFDAQVYLSRAYLQKRMYERARLESEKAAGMHPKSMEALWLKGCILAAAGDSHGAREILKAPGEQDCFGRALIHCALREPERAMELLERAFQNRETPMFLIKVDPLIDPIRSEKRFKELLRKMGLPDSHELSGDGKLSRIAVLPFKPLNAQQRDEYLELGMADALITRLSELKQLVVSPTSAVRRYSDLDQDSVQAGKALGVDSVLEGSIQKFSDRLRITVRLIRVQDGSSLWAGKFDERYTDIFAVEDSISERLTAALALKLTYREKENLTKRYTENTEAYTLYLQGRYHCNQRAEGALNKSIECYRQAIEIDPNYALAYAGLSESYTYLGDAGITAIPAGEAFARGKEAASRALEIDQTLAEAHTSMAHLNMHLFQWSEAEAAFHRTFELKPNYATAYQLYSYYLLFTGKTEEALPAILRARELDPLSEPINADLGDILYLCHRYEESIQHLQALLKLDPLYWRARIFLARAYQQVQRFDEAIAEVEKAVQLSMRTLETLAALGYSYAVAGRKNEALELVAELQGISKQRYVSPYNMALIYVALGDNARALESLELAYDGKAEWMIYLSVDPRLDPIRHDPHFQELLKRIGLPQLG